MSKVSKEEDNGSVPPSEKLSNTDGQEPGPSVAAAAEQDESSINEPETPETQNPQANRASAPPDPTRELPIIRHVYHPTRGAFANYQRPSAIRTISIIESISSHPYDMVPPPYQFPLMPFMNSFSFMSTPYFNMHFPLDNPVHMGPGLQHFAPDFQPPASFTQMFPNSSGSPHFYDQLQMEYQLLSEHLNETYGRGYPPPSAHTFNSLYSTTVVITSTSWFNHPPGLRPNRNRSRRGTGSSRQNSGTRGSSSSMQFENSASGGLNRAGHSSSFVGANSTPQSGYTQTQGLIVNPVPWVASDTLKSTNGYRMKESSSAASEEKEPPSNSEETYETSFPPLGEDRRGKKGKHSADRKKGSISPQMSPTGQESTACSSDMSVGGKDQKTTTAMNPGGAFAPFEQLPPELQGTSTRSWADVAAGVLAFGPSLSPGLGLNMPGSRQQEVNATFEELQEEAAEYACDIDIEILQNHARTIRQIIQEDMEQQLEDNARRNALRLLEELEEDQSNGDNQLEELDEE